MRDAPSVPQEPEPEPEAECAIVEIMGHRKPVGLIREEQRFGAALLRIDVPGADGGIETTLYYAGAALFSVTPVTEATARELLERERCWREPRRYEPPRLTTIEEARANLDASDDLDDQDAEL